MKIVIDQERCTGHGRCYSLVPELFDADEAGRGVVVAGTVTSGSEELAHRAAAGCPERAIDLLNE